MIHVKCLTFNPFQENTYIVYNEAKECIIFDPGCYTPQEKIVLSKFIEENQLTPVKLINTHCHLDHVFGNKFVENQYKIGLEIHKGELPVLQNVPKLSELYGIPLPDEMSEPQRFIEVGEIIRLGDHELIALFTPGHSPASLSFYCPTGQFIIAGDVLFEGSIGRTDLPGGDYNTLINSIKKEFFPLEDDVVVYPGHGNSTTIGTEKRSNPFLN